MAGVAELILKFVGKDEASAVAKGVGDAATSMGTKLKVGAGVGIAAVGGIGAVFAGVANDMTKATNEFEVQLGVTGAEADRLGQIAKGVYGDNFAGSIEDAAGVIAQSFKSIGDVGDDELKRVAENAIRLQDSFGVDTAESISAAKTLMENFGLSSDQAFDLIASGFQKGLNRSDDFLDTIGEYSTQFKNGGATADQFFSLLESGLQGGMLGTDKAADAFKEFRVRILDGSKTTSDALQQIGIDADTFTAKIASGEITTAQAFQTVIEKLRETDDASIQMQAGVGLIGTQFEDLGTDAALALDLSKTKLDETAGSAESLDAKYNTIGSTIEGIKRKAELGIAPMAGQIAAAIPVAAQLGLAVGGLAPLIGAIGPAFAAMSAVALPALGSIGAALLLPPVGIIVALVAAGVAVYVFRDQIKDGIGAAASFVTEKAAAIGGAITGALGEVLKFGKDHWPEIATLISGPFAPIVILATDAFGIRSALTDAFEAILSAGKEKFDELRDGIGSRADAARDWVGGAFAAAKEAAVSRVTELKDTAVQKFEDLLTFMGGLPPRVGEIAGSMGNAIRDGLVNGIEGTVGVIGDLGEALLAALKTVINSAIDAVNIAIPNSLSISVLGKSIGVDLPDNPIPHLAAGGIVRPRPGGTVVRVAEAGQPEAIVPLDGRHGFGGGDVYGNLQIVLPNYRNDGDLMRQLDRAVAF